MKKIALVLLMAGLVLPVMAEQAPWLIYSQQALDKAGYEGKLVLMDFTGSDWCGWCMKLEAETFSQPEFISYAANNLVLVQVDLPHKTPQSEELKTLNHGLEKKFNVHGYPTLVLLKPDGTEVWRQVGYLAGGPKAMIAKIQEVRPKGAAVAGSSLPFGFSTNAPAAPVQKANTGPRLQGIFYSTTHPSALVNGKILGEGESVDGVRVVKIDRTKVTVETGGKTRELTMQ
jgi:thioredoxin-related protein